MEVFSVIASSLVAGTRSEIGSAKKKIRPKVSSHTADTGASFRLESVMSAVVPTSVPAHAPCCVALGVPGLLRWLQPHRLSVANKLKATLWICGLGLVAIAAVYAWTGHANALAARSQATSAAAIWLPACPRGWPKRVACRPSMHAVSMMPTARSCWPRRRRCRPICRRCARCRWMLAGARLCRR